MVRKAVADKARVALSGFLFDWVHGLICNYHLCIGPPRDLDDHVENASRIAIGQKGYIMDWRDNMAVLFDEYAIS